MKIKITPAEIKNLAPMSATISRLTNMVYQPNASSLEIARLIELDQAMTANVLRWSNSAFYGARVPVESVKTAVVRLGMNNIIKLSISKSLATPMKKSLPGYEMVENELWRHNVAAGLTIESLAPFIEGPIHPAAFTAALLHDVGKQVLGRHLQPELIAEIRQLVNQAGLAMIRAERQVLETDHAEVGAAMAGYWKFPDELIMTIEKHHEFSVEKNDLLDHVQIANLVAKRIGVGVGSETLGEEAGVNKLLERQSLDEEKFSDLCELVQERLASAEEEWEI